MTKDPFIVLALPRSRTKWLSMFLSYDDRRCGHDTAIDCDTVQQFLNQFASRGGGLAGTVETGAMIGWRLLRAKLPNLKTLVIMREPSEVLASLARQGLSGQWLDRDIGEKWMMLTAIANDPEVTVLDWRALNDPLICKELFEKLLGIEWDEEWYERFSATNIQIDLFQRLTRLQYRAKAIAAFKEEVLIAQRDIPKGMIFQ